MKNKASHYQRNRASNLLRFRGWVSCIFCLLIAARGLGADDNASSPNLIPHGDMIGSLPKENPWAGVRNGVLAQIPGSQRCVSESGKINLQPFCSSVAIGDLNGDGLPDLVVADPRGFFWFYPNNGTATVPKFTHGEVMPIWVGEVAEERRMGNPVGEGLDNTAPRINLVDIDGDRKLDLVVGTYAGKLYYFRNTGSTTQPAFSVPQNDLRNLDPIKTRSDGNLWCNFLSPFLCDWYHHQCLDLIMGDGSYSENSIFLFKNMGSSVSPVFNEKNRTRLISGMGRELLTPVLVDWNNDGKPDVLTGERTGTIDLYLNTSIDQEQSPTFADPQELKFGSQQKFNGMTSVAVGSLSGNSQVPDLVLADTTNHLYYAKNTGKPGSPIFSATPAPIPGANPWSSIQVPIYWCMGTRGFGYNLTNHDFAGYSHGGPFGVPYELLTISNGDEDSAAQPPAGVGWKSFLRYFVFDPQNKFFVNQYYPYREDKAQSHGINYVASGVPLISETRYKLTYWIRAQDVHDVGWNFFCVEKNSQMQAAANITIENSIPATPTWTQMSDDVSWDDKIGQKNSPGSFGFGFYFYGQGELDLADVRLTKDE